MLVLGLSVPLMKKLGIDGVGFALLGASFIVAVARFPTIARALRQPSIPAPLPRPQQVPGSAKEYVTEDDRTTIFSPLAWGEARYQVAMGHVPQRPEEDLTVLLSPMTWPGGICAGDGPCLAAARG